MTMVGSRDFDIAPKLPPYPMSNGLMNGDGGKEAGRKEEINFNIFSTFRILLFIFLFTIYIAWLFRTL